MTTQTWIYDCGFETTLETEVRSSGCDMYEDRLFVVGGKNGGGYVDVIQV